MVLCATLGIQGARTGACSLAGGDEHIQDHFVECRGDASPGVWGEISQERRLTFGGSQRKDEIIQKKNGKDVLGMETGCTDAVKQE